MNYLLTASGGFVVGFRFKRVIVTQPLKAKGEPFGVVAANLKMGQLSFMSGWMTRFKTIGSCLQS